MSDDITAIAIQRGPDGVIDPSIPTSTLEELSYERTALSQFMREEGRLKFFFRREIQTSARDLSTCPPPRIVTVMIGEHRFESEEQYDGLVHAVRAGATLVCSLSAFYGERTKGQVYLTRDLRRLAGVELGDDVPLWVMRSLPDQDTNVTRHYNRVRLEGAQVLRCLPNGDPWLVEHGLGAGHVRLSAHRSRLRACGRRAPGAL